MIILLIAYGVLGYWAVGQTIYANKVVFYTRTCWLFTQKLNYALVFGLGADSGGVAQKAVWALITIIKRERDKFNCFVRKFSSDLPYEMKKKGQSIFWIERRDVTI